MKIIELTEYDTFHSLNITKWRDDEFVIEAKVVDSRNNHNYYQLPVNRLSSALGILISGSLKSEFTVTNVHSGKDIFKLIIHHLAEDYKDIMEKLWRLTYNGKDL